jgi:hypothetical protein
VTKQHILARTAVPGGYPESAFLLNLFEKTSLPAEGDLRLPYLVCLFL